MLFASSSHVVNFFFVFHLTISFIQNIFFSCMYMLSIYSSLIFQFGSFSCFIRHFSFHSLLLILFIEYNCLFFIYTANSSATSSCYEKLMGLYLTNKLRKFDWRYLFSINFKFSIDIIHSFFVFHFLSTGLYQFHLLFFSKL
jgi:hypothetical protein